MSEHHDVKRWPTEKWEWIWRAGVAALLVVNLFLKSNYVDLSRYERDRSEMQAAIIDLAKAQSVASERDKVNDRQDERLSDHEARLRIIESKLPH